MKRKISIEALAREQIKAAQRAGGRRAAETVFGGHEKVLRQTVMGLLKDAEIGERENLDEATIYVLEGRVQLWVGDDCWEARQGSLLVLPQARHRLVAIMDSALLITVAKLSTSPEEPPTSS
ncbi:LuxR family transcriptional regulator [Brachybacterium vulturis]|uniref:LuxR family transcriptional regulator n=1 Tax=Brachybacterium vulturis TaxID=2017484 RepID=A0A291GPF6_9MICO|nr:LuxR family transcriptional regulator [Brachybacterium vulturis]ATG52125.1 LuxR family transcriptional regulator [Brachybacterium vulturis]